MLETEIAQILPVLDNKPFLGEVQENFAARRRDFIDKRTHWYK